MNCSKTIISEITYIIFDNNIILLEINIVILKNIYCENNDTICLRMYAVSSDMMHVPGTITSSMGTRPIG